MTHSPHQLAQYIDHTLLKAQSTSEEIRKLCQEALKYEFYSVCVNPLHVPLATKLVTGSNVKVCSVVGFPLGATLLVAKANETRLAVENGANEIDMVMAVGALKGNEDAFVGADIEAVVKAAGRAPVKVIIETCFLNDDEKVRACELAKNAGAAFVKTSTGFGTSGAAIEDIKLMRQVVGPNMGVKASGGIRDYAVACAMIEAGANRLGTSSGIAIVSGDKGQGDY